MDLATYESDSGIAFITLNRPEKLNAINVEMANMLAGYWRRFRDSEDRVAVVSGAGTRAFTAGADIADVSRPGGVAAHHAATPSGHVIDKPVILAVSGYCIGLGLDFLRSSDLCVAAENAQFSYPEARKFGLGSGRVPSMVGQMPAKIVFEMS